MIDKRYSPAPSHGGKPSGWLWAIYWTVLVCFVGTPAFAEEQLPDARIAWAEPTGAGFDIWFSRTDGKNWTNPQQITVKRGMINVLGCPLDMGDGRTVVVWSRFTSSESADLLYSIETERGWSEPKKIETGLSLNMAVSLLRAPDGTVWLAWSGYDGTDDDIFATRWLDDEETWETKTRVGRNDAKPDILPVLQLDDDAHLTLRWQGLGSTGYRVIESRWDGSIWDTESVVAAEELSPEKDVVRQRLENVPELPSAVTDPHKACINIMDGARVHTVRFPSTERNPLPGQ